MSRSIFEQYVRIARLGVFLGASVGMQMTLSAQETPVAPPVMPQGTGSAPSQAAPGAVMPSDERRPQGQSATGPGAPVNSSSYKIGAADVLSIHVWNEGQFTGPAIVHEDGLFTMPLIGDLKAGNMTPMQVEKEIAEALAKYVRQPLVTVTVQQVGSKQYYMDGQINRSGEYQLLVPTTILEAISKAGGIQAFANGKKIYVLRGTKRIPFNYKDVLRGKHMDQNIHLQPGDHVVVP